MTQFDKLPLEDLKRRQAQVKAQILESASSITDVVHRDAPRWMEREARKRFLEHVEFASQMSDAQLSEFKQALRASGEAVAQELAQELAQEKIWLTPAPAPENRKSLEGHPALWSLLQQTACKLSEILSRFEVPRDLGEDGDPPYQLVYRTPMYFVDGVYCPSLIETYWSRLDEFEDLEHSVEARQAVTSRQVLEKRWEDA